MIGVDYIEQKASFQNLRWNQIELVEYDCILIGKLLRAVVYAILKQQRANPAYNA